MDWTALGGWVTAAAAVVGGLYFNWRQAQARDRSAPGEARKLDAETAKTHAEADSEISQAWGVLLGPIKAELAELRDENKSQAVEMQKMRENSAERDHRISVLENKLSAYLAGIRKLIAQLMAANMTPVWTPDDEGH